MVFVDIGEEIILDLEKEYIERLEEEIGSITLRDCFIIDEKFGDLAEEIEYSETLSRENIIERLWEIRDYIVESSNKRNLENLKGE